ncbi:hypothetical protein SB758_41075, partial [Burkholderia sp. SIMBA_013]
MQQELAARGTLAQSTLQLHALALALATLFRVMVTHACALEKPGTKFTAEARWLLKENRWQAKRYGAAGTFAL